jgi:outer membrane protein assembly factor BamD (BamD/ComL family)
LAIQGFVAFERAHWDHALADRALLMAARAAIRAADDLGDPKPKRERIAQAVDTLTALLRRYPDSETARAAERAIEYWRRRSEQP